MADSRPDRLSDRPPDGAFVLVHGGAHGAWCWDPLVPLLPGRVLAIDLPPKSIRGVRGADAVAPPELATTSIDDFATSAIADIDAAGIDRFVLVGHSMGGLTIPEVARRIPERVEHLVFVSCTVPPEGGCTIDALREDLREMTRAAMEAALAGDGEGMGAGLDEDTVRRMFCNDMDEEQTAFVLAHTGVEATRPFVDIVSRVGIPPELPKTYVRLAQDQALTLDDQNRNIANLRDSPGGPIDVIDLDTGHDVMISAPDRLAAVLRSIADLSG